MSRLDATVEPTQKDTGLGWSAWIEPTQKDKD